MTKPIVLTFDDFTLRPWQEGDEVSLAKHANNHKIWINVRDHFPHPYTLKDAELWVRVANVDRYMINLAIEVDGQAGGAIGIVFKQDIYKRSAEVGYWLGEPFWNRGIISRAVRAISDFVFESPEHDICRIYAGVFDYNQASARVLEKAGFHLEARLKKNATKEGKTVDELIYARLKDE
ncbi:GNAT family protein [Porifericola rhodea]|uniref:GNAT family N-acetyltransferase n=1 Tax=Porifericola rhodea TaxID=930972 RepID=UPI002665AC68|nr:GNAT family protein [Porifericola rhodea]WKN33547.1 GNAT family protein [Porifericola rhodea]